VPRRGAVWLALWTVYVVWGSTYLAIRLGVRPAHGAALPPLLLAGARFTLAGALLLAYDVRRPAPDGKPDPLGRRQWLAAAVVGLALLLGGNGLVSIAEERIPSGVAALVVGTVPIWAALLGAAWGRERVSLRHGAGLLLGFAGVATLVAGTGSGRVSPTGVLIVLGAALSWAAGSVWSRTAPAARRPLVSTGMQMLCGGAGCFAAGLGGGEGGRLHLGAVSTSAWLALAYLVVFGSMLAYTAYIWLLQNASLTLVTTYAYVNPLVAVLLGALFVHEALTLRTVLAAALIVTGVGLLVGRTARDTEEPVASSEGAAPSATDRPAQPVGCVQGTPRAPETCP